MKSRPTPIRAGSQARKLYDRLHLGWRAGVLDSWYYGRRSPTDSTVVWQVDGVEYDGNDLAGVAESAVVASPDEIRGAIVKAFVILAPGYQPSPELVEELQEHVKRVTAPYKYPREIEFVDDLPKTLTGKIRRIELREREARR